MGGKKITSKHKGIGPSKSNSALQWLETFKIKDFRRCFVFFFFLQTIHGFVYYGTQENKKKIIHCNEFPLLRQKIIKTFTRGEKVTEHKLLKIQFPLLLEGNFIPGAKQLKYKQTSTTLDQIWLRI